MRIRRALLFTFLAAMAACSDVDASSTDAPGTEPVFDEIKLGSIANEFAIKKGMTLLCEGDDKDYLTPFMEDLRQAGVPSELRDGIMADSVEMMNKISTEEPEYICTPEMFESSAARAAEAQHKWDRMRGLEE